MNSKNIEDVYPLSPTQQGILFHSLYAPKAGVYCGQMNCLLQGNLDVSVFERAWQQVVDRHPVLRTAFVWKNLEKPLQVVGWGVKLPWQEYDWRGLSASEQQEQLKTFLQADRHRGFQLSKAPLMRLTLIQLNENDYQFIWSYHHLILDGWSGSLLLKEIIAFYEAFRQGQDLHLELPYPYRDYIAWLQQQDLSEAKLFWHKTLSGVSVPTSLKVDQLSNSLHSQDEEDYDEQQIELLEATTTALESLARQHHLTLNTLVQGAWGLLLSRYSGESDVVFGATVSGRSSAFEGSESAIGLFINTLPMRVYVHPEMSLISWLKQLQSQQVSVRQYEYSPLVEIQGWSQVPRNLPLFESIVVFENYPIEYSRQNLSKDLQIKSVHTFEKTHYPLTLVVMPGSKLVLKLSYDCQRFEQDTITRMLGHLQTLLQGMETDSQMCLKDLPLLTEPERHQLLVEWNDTQADYPQNQCIHQLFEAQVERTPDAVAVVFEDARLTYRELNTRANQLAHYLQKLEVKSEVLVGICVERSLSMVIGLLAILKAGGAYLPIDPSYPKERLAYMLADSQPSVLLTQQYLVENLPNHKAQVICIDSDWELIANENPTNPLCKITDDNLAYVIYTSGSTGKPKGAMLPHHAICNHMLWMQSEFLLTQADKVLQKTPFSFDASVWEFYAPLLVGAQLVIARPGGHQDSDYLIKTIIEQQISTLQLVPSLLQMLLECGGIENCQSLKRVFSGGEALSVALQERFFANLDAELHNLYGPTETCIDVISWTCKPDINQQVVPIGRAIANTQVYLLDSRGQPVPVGVTGELHISGEQLALGYLNCPELTAEKFIPNPFGEKLGVRLYKTGDLARYLANGHIEYLGRIDHQVKVRGFRIELGEIESVIIKHPGVRETVVIVTENSVDFQRIVAYVVPQKDQILTIPELRRFLELKLPNYMLPAAFITLDALPLTPNGKVDRKALPAPDTARPDLEAVYQPPQTEIEQTVADIWQKVLNIENLGIHDNFFELGGHSLLLIQVHNKLQKIFPLNLLILDLFRYPTISLLAEFLSRANNNEPLSDAQTDTRTQQLTQGKDRIKQFLTISKRIK